MLWRTVISVFLVAFAGCRSHGSPRGEPSQNAPEPAGPDRSPTPQKTPEAGPLAYRFTTAATWREHVEVDLYSSNRGGPLPDAPTMTERRVEQFEVVDQQGDTIRVELTVVHLELQVPGKSTVDSDQAKLADVDPLALERLAVVGIPCVYILNRRGEVVDIADVSGYRRAVRDKWETLVARAGSTPRDPAAFIDAELASSREWSIRPVLPLEPVAPSGEWDHSLTTSTLFNAEVTWSIKHIRKDAPSGQLSVARDGEASFDRAQTMARYLRSATASLHGSYVVDLDTSALLNSETTVEATVEAAPQPQHNFEGGLLTMRRVTRRHRVDSPDANR